MVEKGRRTWTHAMGADSEVVRVFGKRSVWPLLTAAPSLDFHLASVLEYSTRRKRWNQTK